MGLYNGLATLFSPLLKSAQSLDTLVSVGHNKIERYAEGEAKLDDQRLFFEIAKETLKVDKQLKANPELDDIFHKIKEEMTAARANKNA